MKKPKHKLNPASRKLLHKMTASVMAPHESKPSLHLHGAHAKQFHGHKPGSAVSAHVKGRLKNVGFGYDNEPHAEIEVNSVDGQGEPGEGQPQEEQSSGEEQDNSPRDNRLDEKAANEKDS